MQTQEANMSKGDELRAFFTENPDAATVATARQFECHAGYVSAIKKKMGLNRLYQARKKSAKKVKKVKPATHTNGTFKNGAGWQKMSVAEFKKTNGGSAPHTVNFPSPYAEVNSELLVPMTNDVIYTLTQGRSNNVPLSPWADYGLWMDRDSLKGYLRGRAVEYLTKGDKLSVEEALRCVTKLAELTGE